MLVRLSSFILSISLSFSCAEKSESAKQEAAEKTFKEEKTSIVVLGTAQDAGSPQIGCTKKCCSGLFEDPTVDRRVAALGLIDTEEHKTFLFEATPDMVRQVKMLTSLEQNSEKQVVDGIFLTHAHIGHYTGLMYLGKEATDADKVPVYAMPRMREFLSESGPWSQLVNRQNIILKNLNEGIPISLSASIQIIPLIVPHRDEFSETVGYKIVGPNKSALFIPDIDKWDKWEKDIIEEIHKVDYAFLDATFFSGVEINNRDISEIPHPFVVESLVKFKDLPKKDRNKIVFIHFNHTNPLLDAQSDQSKQVAKEGYRIARIGQTYEL